MGGELEQAEAAELRSALSWWLEAGVDVVTQEVARNWLKPAAADSVTPQPSEQPAPSAGAALPDNLEQFRNWLRETKDLPFAGNGNRVLPVGTEAPDVMLMTDMAGADCAPEQGPLGGDAWQLTQRMLRAAGFAPDRVYRASLSCFHLVSGLQRGADFDACTEIARRHIALVRPQRLLLLGEGPCRALLGKSLAAARGHVQKVEGVRSVATFHPRFLMDYPLQKDAAWADLLLLTEE